MPHCEDTSNLWEHVVFLLIMSFRTYVKGLNILHYCFLYSTCWGTLLYKHWNALDHLYCTGLETEHLLRYKKKPHPIKPHVEFIKCLYEWAKYPLVYKVNRRQCWNVSPTHLAYHLIIKLLPMSTNILLLWMPFLWYFILILKRIFMLPQCYCCL